MQGRFVVFAGQELVVAGAEAPEPYLDGAALEGLARVAGCDFEWKGSSLTALSLEKTGEFESRGLSAIPIRQALGLWPEDELRPVLKALALLNWIAGTKYCSACGAGLPPRPAPSESAAGDGQAGALLCPSCGRSHFPRISPAVIVLVKKEGRALLARNARIPPGGRFGLLAGFVEAGETLEEAAAREVREEAGIEIEDLRYVASQPWPFPDSLMMAFTARWASGEARPDGEEIAELRWCGPDELPEVAFKGSVARSLIDDFVRGS